MDWIKRYILFHGKRHSQETGEQEVEQFLSHLAVERNVAASTPNQALSAILFLYEEAVQQRDIGWLASTTLIYTHVLNRGGRGVVSPLDAG